MIFFSYFENTKCNILHCSWQPETKFLFSRSRLPLKESKGPHTFVENQEVEVYSKANEQEAFGWWKAVIKVNTPIFYYIKEN